jgi:hypothetical protein
LSPIERASREKHLFETTVGVALDAELVSMNLDGRLLERIATLAPIVAHWGKLHLDDTFDLLAQPTRLPNGRLQSTSLDRMVGVLMRIAGLTDRTGIKANHVVAAAGLTEFAHVCRENQTVIEETFGDAIRDDLRQNPVRQLNAFLKRVGLKLRQVRSEKTKGGGKLRFYSLDPSSAARMTSLAQSFLEVESRREDGSEGRRRSRDQTLQQGTAEKPSYLDSNMNLLSLIDPD